MIGVAIITLTLLVGQVVTHPADLTMNDDGGHNDTTVNDDGGHNDTTENDDGGHNDSTVNDGEEGVEILSVIEPFEMTNPSRVAAGELYQSDMLLTEEQWAAMKMRKAIANVKYRWSEGSDGYPLVPYIFKDSVNKDDVRAALDHWTDRTCIKFEDTSNTERPHLQFHIGGGCWSFVGMLYYKDGQEISIGSGCNSLGTIVHEVGHALGFHHEQSRSDRDDHVIILTDNIQDGKEGNFKKATDNNYNVMYDYSSIMHYGMTYFTKNGDPTIVTKDPMAQELIGSRSGLTHRDKLLANTMYKCIEKWLTKCSMSSDPCLNEGYTGKDCACVCPPGTSGSKCEKIEGDYYGELLNPLSEKISSEKSIKIETPMNSGTTFVKWIIPPTCKKAKVTFKSSNMYSTCRYQYLNCKTDPSDVVGQKMCAADVTNGKTITSDTGIIITMVNNVRYGSKKTLWEADVTFESIPKCTATDPPTPVPTKPKTPVPTDPETPVPTKPPTTPPVTVEACEKKPKKQTLKTSITIASPSFPIPYNGPIKCGYKLKAPRKHRLTITCDTFSLNSKAKLQISRKSFTGNTAPSLTMKRLNIKFKAKKNTSGPGFRCTVTVVPK